MRAVIVGEANARRDFIAGWQTASCSAVSALGGIDELQQPHATLSLLTKPARILACGGAQAFASTAAFSAALCDIAQLAAAGPLTVLAAESLEHDGGAGAWQQLDEHTRNLLVANAARLEVATHADTPLLGLYSRSQQLCPPAQRERAAIADQQITEFITDANLPGTAPERLRLARSAGSAMAGGVAFIFAALGAQLVPARRVFARSFHWARQIADAEVVIVLTSYDSAEIAVDPILAEVAGLACEQAKACAVVATDHHLPRRAFATLGVSDLYTRGQRSWYEMGVALAQTWR